MQMQTVLDNVRDLLETIPETRFNDHLLYVHYLETYYKVPFTRENFIKFKQSFEGISRARRKIQEAYPDLTVEYYLNVRMGKQEEFFKLFK